MTEDGRLLTQLQLFLSLVKYFILLYLSYVCCLQINRFQFVNYLLIFWNHWSFTWSLILILW
jgi:hypothetical protein